MLNSYSWCPRQWFYHYILKPSGIKVDDSALLRGIEIHEMVENYFNKIKVHAQLSKDVIEEVATDVFLNSGSEHDKIWDNFIRFEKTRFGTWSAYFPEFTEKEFVSTNRDFKGRIDFYGDGTVIDWKTGAPLQSATQEIMVQGNIYKHLLEENNHKVKKVLFVYLQNGYVLELPSTAHDWVVEKRRHFVESVNMKMFDPNREPAKCKYCPYQLRCWYDGVYTLWSDAY